MSSEQVAVVDKRSSHASEMQSKISAELENIEKNIQKMDELKRSSIERIEKEKQELKEAKTICDEHYETLKEIAAAGKTIHDRKISITKLDRTIIELDEQISKIQAEHDKIVGELELKRRKLSEYLKYYDTLNERLDILLKKLGEEEAKHCEELNNLRRRRSDLLKETDLSQTVLQKKLKELDSRIVTLNKEHENLIDTISKNLSDIALEPVYAAEVEELLTTRDKDKPDDEESKVERVDQSIPHQIGKHQIEKHQIGKHQIEKHQIEKNAEPSEELVILEKRQSPMGTEIELYQTPSGNVLEQHISPSGILTEERRTTSGTVLDKTHVVTEKEQIERQIMRTEKEQRERPIMHTEKEQREGPIMHTEKEQSERPIMHTEKEQRERPIMHTEKKKLDSIVFENEGRTVAVTLDKKNKKLSLSLDGAPQSIDVKLKVDEAGRMSVDKAEVAKLKNAGLLDEPAGLALLESKELNLSELLTEKQIKELEKFEETLQKTKEKHKSHRKRITKDERKHLLSQCLQITPSNRIITKDDTIINVEEARILGLLSNWYDGEEDDASQDQYDISSVKELEDDEVSKYKKKLSDTGLYYDLDSGSQISSGKDSIISVLSTQECDYLKQIFGKSLSLALAEIMAVQPADPIHYLAHWFLKYRYNQEIDEVKRLEIQALMVEQERLEAEKWHTELNEEARLAILEALFRAENIIIQHDFDRAEMLEEELDGEYGEEGQNVPPINPLN